MPQENVSPFKCDGCRQGATQESEFHCPPGTHRERQHCLFQRRRWIELVLKPQTHRSEDRWQELMVSCLILPGVSCATTQLCFYRRWFGSHLKERCHPQSPPLPAAPGMWNPTKPTNLPKHHQAALCAILPPCAHEERCKVSSCSAAVSEGVLGVWPGRLQLAAMPPFWDRQR